MRVGLIADIHGNLPALEAVLAELERERPDEIICLGDVAVGPEPRAAVARLREVGCSVVLGNWDASFIDETEAPESPGDDVGGMVREIHAYWSTKLSGDDREYLRTFVPQLECRIGNVDALFFHGSPRSYDDQIFATTPDAELEEMFDGARPALLVGGHTHVQLVRRWGRSLLVNPGSVGLPFLSWWPETVRVAPWAEYALLTADDGDLHVDLRRTTFDVESYLRSARASGMPHADWWADCWVLD
ncbi:MAG TPA: metallophosphoesterase family protein [Gaiellaceae bacterium]|nr:metallophosphoesterase family protein [Gaiellaceae bacterium]